MIMSNSSLVSYTKLSPNHSGKRTMSIDRITPHCVVGQCTIESLGSWFAQTSIQASSNYGIDKDGRVGLFVDEGNRSWCSSSNANDQRAVTIECASDTSEPCAFRDVVYQKLIDLCTDICRRNGKSKLIWLGDKDKTLNYSPKSNEMILTVHRWFANKSCPGNWMYARMGDLASKVTARLRGSVDPTPQPTPTPSGYPSTPFLVNVIIPDLNIRTSPCIGDNLTGQYTGVGTFTIIEVHDGWGRLKSGAGWIYIDNQEYVTIEKSVSPQHCNTKAQSQLQKKEKPANQFTDGKLAHAEYKDNNLRGAYMVTSNSGLNMRTSAGTTNKIIQTIPYGATVQCYGYYNMAGSTKWLCVVYNGKDGYCSSEYLSKK